MADVFSGSLRLLTEPHYLFLLVPPNQCLRLIKIPPLVGIDLKSTYGSPPPIFWVEVAAYPYPAPSGALVQYQLYVTGRFAL